MRASDGKCWQPRPRPANKKQHPLRTVAYNWPKWQRKTIMSPKTWDAGNAILSHLHISSILPGNVHLHALIHPPKQSQFHAWYLPSILVMCGGLWFLSMGALEKWSICNEPPHIRRIKSKYQVRNQLYFGRWTSACKCTFPKNMLEMCGFVDEGAQHFQHPILQGTWPLLFVIPLNSMLPSTFWLGPGPPATLIAYHRAMSDT